MKIYQQQSKNTIELVYGFENAEGGWSRGAFFSL
jgi:hypothetical protein